MILADKSENTIRRYIKKGDIEHQKIQGKIYIDRASLVALLPPDDQTHSDAPQGEKEAHTSEITALKAYIQTIEKQLHDKDEQLERRERQFEKQLNAKDEQLTRRDKQIESLHVMLSQSYARIESLELAHQGKDSTLKKLIDRFWK